VSIPDRDRCGAQGTASRDPATRDALADFSRTVDELRSAGAPEAPLVRLTELYSVFTRAAMR